METFDYSAIGQRIKTLRKRKGLNQQDLANLMGKSLRTVQKYETGEIEVSIATVSELAKLLDTTLMFLMGYDVDRSPITTMADVVAFFFKLNQVEGLDFQIEVKKPPRHDEWSCSITFDGKNRDFEHNMDMCLFLESFERERDKFRGYYYDREEQSKWEDRTVTYYASTSLDEKVYEKLDYEEQMKRRIAYLNGLHPKMEGEI